MANSRKIPKILKSLAIKEFKEKRPKRIEIRRAKNSQILRRGFGPQVRVMREENILFLMILNYGIEYRMYYLTGNARIVGADNFTKKEYKKNEKKINKYTKIIYKIIKTEPKRLTIEDIKNQINQDFKDIYKKLKRLLDINIKNLPYITITKEISKHNLNFGIYKREKDIITLSNELQNLKGVLYREIFRLIIPKYIVNKTLDRLCLLLVYPFLNKVEQEEWIQNWESIEKISFILEKFTSERVIRLIKILLGLDRYNTINFKDKESARLIQLVIENLEIENENFLFSTIYFSFYNNNQVEDSDQKDKCLQYTICYHFLDNNTKNIYELISKVKDENIKELFTELYYLDLIYIEKSYRILEFNNKKFEKLIQTVKKHQIDKLIKIKIESIFKEVQINSDLKIKCEIINNSKNKFRHLKLKKIYWKPKNYIQLIDQDLIDVFEFLAGECVELNFMFKILKSGKIKIGIVIECKDENNNLYEFKSNKIIIKIDEI